MSVPPGATANTATGSAQVGAQAGTIHGGVHNNYYRVPEGASAAEKFAIARKYLESGQATTARKLMNEVIVEIHDRGEVWFHWLLAFFSARSLRELTAEDRGQLEVAFKMVVRLRTDRWTSGVDLICRIYAAGDARGEGAGAIAEGLERLEAYQNAAIKRHLERVVQGSLKDELWHGTVGRAQADQRAGHREQRVWKFFEPDPAPPRTRPVRPALALRAVRGQVRTGRRRPHRLVHRRGRSVAQAA